MESALKTGDDGSSEPGTRSSAGEHALHTGGVVGSIPTASTTRQGRVCTRAQEPERYFGFSLPTIPGRRRVTDMRYIYFIQSGDLVKVGMTNDVQQRLKAFRLASPRGLYLRGTREVPALIANQTEKQIYRALKDHAVGREWFRMQAKDARAVAEPIIDRAFAAWRKMIDDGRFAWMEW